MCCSPGYISKLAVVSLSGISVGNNSHPLGGVAGGDSKDGAFIQFSGKMAFVMVADEVANKLPSICG